MTAVARETATPVSERCQSPRRREAIRFARFAFCFSVHRHPRRHKPDYSTGWRHEPATPGRLARLIFGDRSGTAACTVEARLERVGEDGWQVAFAVDGTITNQTVKAGQWNNVAVNVPLSARGHGILASFGAAEGGAAATYVALDNLALWYGDTGRHKPDYSTGWRLVRRQG